MNHHELLSDVYAHVDAYRLFLKEQTGSDALPADFESLPLTDKRNYLMQYPLEALCHQGDMDHIHLIGASSGFSKSGAVYWPKRPCDEKGYMNAIEQMFVSTADIDKRKTLCVECLAFGMWIGGMQIAAALRNIALSGKYRFTICTPGLDLKAAAHVIMHYHEYYDQVLIITNPSNIPLFTALFRQDGSSLPMGKITFPVVGEYFSEAFREQVGRQYGHEADAPYVVWTGYGSADTGDVGVETAATIALRKYFHRHQEQCMSVFGTSSAPMILATSPSAYIEIIEGNIVVTKDQFLPLVRYDTKDAGGLLDKTRIKGLVPDQLYASLPEEMLYVYGRVDNAVIFYGTNLMVNDIQDYLLSLPAEMGYGGLFTIHAEESGEVPTFHFTIYTAGSHASDAVYLDHIIRFLSRNSAEFNIKYQNLSASCTRPLITLCTDDISKTAGKTKHRFIV